MQAMNDLVSYREYLSLHGIRGNSKSCCFHYYVDGPPLHPFHLFDTPLRLTSVCGIGGGGQAVVVGNAELIAKVSR